MLMCSDFYRPLCGADYKSDFEVTSGSKNILYTRSQK